MVAEAEKFATADKEKRQNIEVKNQEEALCFEVEKELNLFEDNLAEDKKQNILTLIQDIRNDVQGDKLENLQNKIDQLKITMKEIVETKLNNQSTSDPMSSLNDL